LGGTGRPTQFDVLLTLTKPVIPLAVLIATGQSINNLIFSMVTSQVLRRAQKFSVEGIHLLVRLALPAAPALAFAFACTGARAQSLLTRM
jgi:hypothetical protein